MKLILILIKIFDGLYFTGVFNFNLYDRYRLNEAEEFVSKNIKVNIQQKILNTLLNLIRTNKLLYF